MSIHGLKFFLFLKNWLIVFGANDSNIPVAGKCLILGKMSDFWEKVRFLGKSKRFSYFANYLKPDRSTDVCVLLLAVTTADPLAQLEKVAEKFDLRADASFFLKDLCGPTP